MSNSVIARLLEEAREEFVSNGLFMHMVKTSSKQTLEAWLDHNPEVLGNAVDRTFARQGVESPELKKMIHASLRFRVLAGTVYRTVEYPEVEHTGHEGFCAHQKMDKDTLNFECEVPGNQAQVNAWHAAFGQNCACPFWEPPVKHEEEPTELEKLFKDGDDKYEALQELGIRNRQGER